MILFVFVCFSSGVASRLLFCSYSVLPEKYQSLLLEKCTEDRITRTFLKTLDRGERLCLMWVCFGIPPSAPLASYDRDTLIMDLQRVYRSRHDPLGHTLREAGARATIDEVLPRLYRDWHTKFQWEDDNDMDASEGGGPKRSKRSRHCREHSSPDSQSAS